MTDSAPLAISLIVNYISEPELGRAFEASAVAYKARVAEAIRSCRGTDALPTVFVQLEYDSAELTGRPGITIGRYSPKGRNVSAYAEITKGQIEYADESKRLRVIANAVVTVLREVDQKLHGKVENNVRALIARLEDLNRSL